MAHSLYNCTRVENYKTWRFRLMPGYKRRRLGAHLLLDAHRHLSNPANPKSVFGYDILPFNSTTAMKLLWKIWITEGNFYLNHHEFPSWPGKIESFVWSLYSYASNLGKALLGRDLHSNCD